MDKIYRVQMNSKGMPNFATAVEIADRLPTATDIFKAIKDAEYRGYMKAVEDRPQGYWTNRHKWDNGFVERECSLCGAMKPILMHTAKINYCPNCGARMKGAEDES